MSNGIQGAPVGHGNASNGNGRWESFWKFAAIANGTALAIGLFWIQSLNATIARMESRIDDAAVKVAEIKGNRFTSGDHATLMRKIADDHEKIWQAIFECGIDAARNNRIGMGGPIEP